jgi:RimJ/RimL family protein N-acetyltransferase
MPLLWQVLPIYDWVTSVRNGHQMARQSTDWRRHASRLELTVMAHNSRAIGLYQRTGFSVEGRRAECLLIDGQFIDELYMATVLPAAPADPA